MEFIRFLLGLGSGALIFIALLWIVWDFCSRLYSFFKNGYQ